MMKFLAVVKHEYKKVVLKWSFLIGTLLFPLIAAGFAVVPALIFSIKGEPTRIAIFDQSGKIESRLRTNLSEGILRERAQQAAKDAMKDMTAPQKDKVNSDLAQFGDNFRFVDYNGEMKEIEQVRRELSGRIAAGELDAYLIIPQDFSAPDAKFEFYSRKAGDFIINETFRDALNNAVRSQRLADANISEAQLKTLSQSVDLEVKKLDKEGTESDDEGGFWAGFIIAFMIYLNLAIYGQMIMSTVVEEKETRVAEILFSSARPFELMMGKLVGVGLAGMTQFAIWIGSAAILIAAAIPYFMSSGIDVPLPNITIGIIIYFLIYFLLGFFLYASIFALIGSMVTSVQEGGQFAFFPIMLMLGGFYFCLAVVRDPNSSLSFWSSIVPFIAPMTMPVRIISETPPFWQIGLSISVNVLAIAGLVWVASRVYRVGMLMYGKRATIPEVWKWIRAS
ncbi:MAG: ABC transporter permease [Pyrinomonadaceae bacterium]|nr:ABC transporter permease [Pyrinomonadaceae bacterium]